MPNLLAPTWDNQLAMARKLLAEKGREALRNPHALTGSMCRCGSCFCCAAYTVLNEDTPTPPPAPEPPRAPLVRMFSVCGPCLTYGRLVKTTAQFYVYDEWHGGDVFQGRKRVSIDQSKQGGRYSGAHIEPCPSCRDHARTQYPNGYED